MRYYPFAALRFSEDKNISDRVYWYLSDFPVKAGDRVLAPVGTHDRLQLAIVERTMTATEQTAPYDVRLVKSVAAVYGARKLVADGIEFLEFGGVRYDEKHYTPFGKILLAKQPPKLTDELREYGVTDILEEGDPYQKIAEAKGCVVLVGEAGEGVFRNLLEFSRGVNRPLYDLGLSSDTMEKLRAKLL